MVHLYLPTFGCLPRRKSGIHPIITSHSTDYSKHGKISHPFPLQPRRTANDFLPPPPARSGGDYRALLQNIPPSLVHHYRTIPQVRGAQQIGDSLRDEEEADFVFHECGMDDCPNVNSPPISQFADSHIEADSVTLTIPSPRAKYDSSRCCVATTDLSPTPSPLPSPSIFTTPSFDNCASLCDTEVRGALLLGPHSFPVTATLDARDSSVLPPEDKEARFDKKRFSEEYFFSPGPLRYHKGLPPLPSLSSASAPSFTPSAPSYPYLGLVQEPCSAPISARRNGDVCGSPLTSASPRTTMRTGRLLVAGPHLKWNQDEDEGSLLPLASRCDGLSMSSPRATSPVYNLPPYKSSPDPCAQHDAIGPGLLLATPIPRVSSFSDLWAGADASLKRHAVAGSSDLIDRWASVSANLARSASRRNARDLASRRDGEGLVTKSRDHPQDSQSGDKHNHALVLGIARSIVSFMLHRWNNGASARREVEDSVDVDPPLFATEWFLGGGLHQPDVVEYAESVGRDLVEGEASLREALSVARNLDLEGDAPRQLKGIIAILEEFLACDATSADVRSACQWVSSELRSLSGIGPGPSQNSHSREENVRVRERHRRKRQLQDAMIRVMMRCGEDNEVDEQDVLEVYAVIMQEVNRVEERRQLSPSSVFPWGSV